MAHDHHAQDHGQAHGHGHAHHGHQGAGDRATLRALVIALVLTAGFAAIEAIGGAIAGSLALMADAGHMVTDAASLGLAAFAQVVARRPPSSRATYGHARAEVLAAFVNALAMLVVVGWIGYEALRRLLDPQPVAGGMVLGVASAGLAINLLVAWLLFGARRSVNARAALLHVAGDLLGSLAAIVAGGVILATGWMPIDPLLSLAVALLILRSTWRLLRDTTVVLMEHVPTHLDLEAIGGALAALPGVREVHDLHVWHMSAESIALSAHIGIDDGAEWLATLAAAQRLCRERFGVHHVTLQPSWPVAAPGSGRRRVIPVVPH